ncbi:MAG: hypothetical protein GWN58_64335, partial [Anaerolineae bacterium]|nr:hypothetical protein [Anaerolineae bacterium]
MRRPENPASAPYNKGMFSSGLQKSSSPSSRFALRPWLHLTVIALLGILSYANSFEVPLQFDDGLYIDENPAIKRLSNFVELPDRNASEVHQVLRNRYIAFLTLGLNYYFHALDVRGYHAVNLLIHVLGAFMVYALALLSMRTPRMEGVFAGTEPRYLALLAALVFVAHPVQTQAVT